MKIEARLGERIFPLALACTNCCAPVHKVNTGLGVQVEHYDPDASFRDSVWTHCRTAVATLPPFKEGAP